MMKVAFWLRSAAVAFCLSVGVSACFAETMDDEIEDEEVIDQVDSELKLALVDRCSTSQKRELRAAERLARYITKPDIIETYTKNKLPNGSANWLLERFFDRDTTWDSATAERVRTGFRKIHNRIAKGDVVVRCRKILACNSDANAHVLSGGAEKITFCPNYFDQSAPYQAAVWVHELSHELLGTGDGVYGSAPGRLHDEASRKASYASVAPYVKAGRKEAAEQWEAFAINLIGQYFDDIWKKTRGRAITEAELETVIRAIHEDRDPLGRPAPTPQPSGPACSSTQVCCEPLPGGGCGFCAPSRPACP